eukprot:3786365-Prymnesium_polylepis.2
MVLCGAATVALGSREEGEETAGDPPECEPIRGERRAHPCRGAERREQSSSDHGRASVVRAAYVGHGRLAAPKYVEHGARRTLKHDVAARPSGGDADGVWRRAVSCPVWVCGRGARAGGRWGPCSGQRGRGAPRLLTLPLMSDNL